MTAHEGIERQLMESLAFLERVEKVSRVGGFMVDLNSGLQRWTRQTYRIYEVKEGRALTPKLLDTLLTSEVRARLHSGTGCDLELPIVTARGRPIWIRLAAEVEYEGSAPVRLIGAVEDVTQRRLADQQLLDALATAQATSRAKSEFLADMSHEIRTPLSAIIGLGYLLQQTALSEDQQQFLTKLQFAGSVLLGVVNNVLDLSKIEAGEMLLENLPFSPPELARDLGQMLAPQAAAKGVDLTVLIANDLPRTLVGDASRLRQILTNLLHNSIKFTDAGRVTLEVSLAHSAPAHVRLRCVVTDTGIGIEPTLLARLFMPFTQADASTTRRFGGTGLGLSIARRFVELMGGEIGVTSAVTAGSTFWVELPFQRTASLDDTGPVRRAGRPQAPDSLSQADALNEQHSQWLLGVHVLAVDDSDISLQVVRHILESQGALVATCSDGTRALEYVRGHQQQLDAVLMDVQMPLLNGNEITRRIREELELRSLPVVALTAGALVGERERCLEAGMNDFISKPFDPPVLIHKLRRLVHRVGGIALPGARTDALPLDDPGSSRWPALPSLDTGLLRRMYGEEVELVRSLLARLLTEYVDLEQPFAVPVDELGARALRCRVHKLKGSAGLLGATQLMQRAGAVETALQDGRETQMLEQALRLMRSALRALREEARSLVEQPAAQPENSRAQTPSCHPLDEDIAQLCDLLDQQDLQAIDRFHGLARSWRELSQMAEFECVREAIETLQFTTASAQLRLVWSRRGASSVDAVAK